MDDADGRIKLGGEGCTGREGKYCREFVER